MSVQDLELNCHVRGVLARHWIDSNRLGFRARRGHVELAGEFCVIGAPQDLEKTASVLVVLESEIKRVQAVRTVSFELTNWLRDDSGTWVCTEKGVVPPQAAVAERSTPEGVEAPHERS